MGKSLPSSTKLQEFTKVVASEKFQRPNRRSPKVKAQLSSPSPESSKGFVGVGLETLRLKMESSERRNSQRSPLSEVVSDCVKRWFQDTLKEARAGDRAMQLLVGQMYYSGYGIPKDAHKVLLLLLLFFDKLLSCHRYYYYCQTTVSTVIET